MEKHKQIITKKEFLEELTAMLNVCFEAEAVQEAEGVRLTFPSGKYSSSASRKPPERFHAVFIFLFPSALDKPVGDGYNN